MENEMEQTRIEARPRTRGVTRAAGWMAAAALVVAGTLSGCAVVDRSSAPPLSKADTWALLPLANNTETPQAGQRAASIAQSLMTSYGYSNLARYPASSDDETLFDPAKPDQQQAALAWARQQNAHYALTGAVNEWRYKVGVDGEPAVGITFDVIDVQSGKVIWSGTGSRTGWSRDAVSGVAQKLERDLLAPLGR
jgi:polysaccharide biosynthesis protein PelC